MQGASAEREASGKIRILRTTQKDAGNVAGNINLVAATAKVALDIGKGSGGIVQVAAEANIPGTVLAVDNGK